MRGNDMAREETVFDVRFFFGEKGKISSVFGNVVQIFIEDAIPVSKVLVRDALEH
jgi:hypothetical protein